MTIEERISEKNSDELSNLLSELEKERNLQEDANDLIEFEIGQVSKDILKLRARGKDLEDALRKGRKLVRDKRLDQKICERAFWRSKGK